MELWAEVLNDENPFRRSLIDQVTDKTAVFRNFAPIYTTSARHLFSPRRETPSIKSSQGT
jgi:hypothetical protein